MKFIEDQIADLREQERAAYMQGHKETSDLLAELVDVKIELLATIDRLGESERLIEQLQAELGAAQSELRYLRYRLALAEEL